MKTKASFIQLHHQQNLRRMKTIKQLAVVLAVAFASVATAVEKPKLNVQPLSPERAVVTIQNEKEAIIELSIYADNGDLVYYKKSSEPVNNYQKVFDFKDLQEGQYSLHLRVNNTKLEKTFQVDENGITVGEEKMRFDPYFSYNNGVLKFSYLNFDREKYYLSIYNEDGLVYESPVGKDFNLTNGYDLSSLESGNYLVVLSSAKNEYRFSLEK